MTKTKLGGLFYPIEDTEGNKIEFDSLYIPYIYREIYFEGIYTDILNTDKPMTIVDVGANIGVVTSFMRTKAKKLYAIEPSTEHFEALKKNKEFNNWDNVEIFNYAIDDHNGEETLHHSLSNRTCNSLAMVFKGETTDKVKVKSMDTFFEENNIEEVDFMKFDVEGAEDVILRSEGFKKVSQKIKAIEVEFHFPTWQDLVKYMVEELGFKARRYQSSAIIVLFTR
jgi:FkbM family methyltransferase